MSMNNISIYNSLQAIINRKTNHNLEEYEMTITFTVEPYSEELIEEMSTMMFQKHWEELAMDKKTIPLDPDFTVYENAQKNGTLLGIMARDDGKLIGYQVYFIFKHHHYKNTIVAQSDIYYITPEYRKKGIGEEFFKWCDKALQERGVQKVASNCKVYSDHQPLFESMGYRLTEKLFTKCF